MNKVITLISLVLLASLMATSVNAGSQEKRNQDVFNLCIHEVYPPIVDATGKVFFLSAYITDFMQCLRKRGYQHPEEEVKSNEYDNLDS